MSSFYSIVHVQSCAFRHFTDDTLVRWGDGLKRVPIGGIHELIVDEQLVRKAEVHIIDMHFHLFKLPLSIKVHFIHKLIV